MKKVFFIKITNAVFIKKILHICMQNALNGLFFYVFIYMGYMHFCIFLILNHRLCQSLRQMENVENPLCKVVLRVFLCVIFTNKFN